MHRFVRGVACALAVAVFAAPLSAAVYTIQLKNGSSFESRYEPEEASWDAGKVVFLDEVGLSIAVDRAEIEAISSDFESKGYGSMLDSTTMELGWAPNDLAAPAEPGSQDPMAQLQQMMGQQQRPDVTYGQFVEPDQTQGIPSQWIGVPGTGGQTQPVIVPVQMPAPAAPPAVGQ